MPRTYSYTGDSCPKVSLRAPLPHVVITDINGLLVQQSSRPATCVKGCDALRHCRIRDFAKPLRYVVSHSFRACQNHRSGITQCLAPEAKDSISGLPTTHEVFIVLPLLGTAPPSGPAFPRDQGLSPAPPIHSGASFSRIAQGLCWTVPITSSDCCRPR